MVEFIDVILMHHVEYSGAMSGLPILVPHCSIQGPLDRAACRKGRKFGLFAGKTWMKLTVIFMGPIISRGFTPQVIQRHGLAILHRGCEIAVSEPVQVLVRRECLLVTKDQDTPLRFVLQEVVHCVAPVNTFLPLQRCQRLKSRLHQALEAQVLLHISLRVFSDREPELPRELPSGSRGISFDQSSCLGNLCWHPGGPRSACPLLVSDVVLVLLHLVDGLHTD